MHELKFRIVVALSLVLCFPSFGDWAKRIEPSDFELAGPPAEGSAAYKKDFKELHRLQDEREEKDCALARKQVFPSFAVFYSISESPLTKAEASKAKVVIGRVMNLAVRIGSYFKKQYERPRPYDVDETIKPCAQKPGGSKAYPSSHAAAATASSCVLAEIYPKKADEINEYGKYLGDLRMIVGVHHPSDVKDGQTLGEELCKRLLDDEEFKEELEAL